MTPALNENAARARSWAVVSTAADARSLNSASATAFAWRPAPSCSVVVTTSPAAFAVSISFILGVMLSRWACIAVVSSSSSSCRFVASAAAVPVLGHAARAGRGRVQLGLDRIDLVLRGSVGVTGQVRRRR